MRCALINLQGYKFYEAVHLLCGFSLHHQLLNTVVKRGMRSGDLDGQAIGHP